MPTSKYFILNGLAELLQAEVHALHDYLREIENRMVLELPASEVDFEALDGGYRRKDEVRESAAVYSVQ